MIREERAHAIRYDAARDEARLVVMEPSSKVTEATVRVDLLLDHDGLLVGVDLGGEGLARVVVMHGAHEDVSSTRSSEVTLVRDGNRICAVVVPKARSMVPR